MKRILTAGAALLSVAVFLGGCVADRKGPGEFEGIEDPAELAAAVDRYAAAFDADPQLIEDRYTSMVLVAYGCLAKHNLDPEQHWTADEFPERESVQSCSNHQIEVIAASVLTVESVGKKTPSEYGKGLVDKSLNFAMGYRDKAKTLDPATLLAWARLQGKIARYENENRDRASVPR